MTFSGTSSLTEKKKNRYLGLLRLEKRSNVLFMPTLSFNIYISIRMRLKNVKPILLKLMFHSWQTSPWRRIQSAPLSTYVTNSRNFQIQDYICDALRL